MSHTYYEMYVIYYLLFIVYLLSIMDIKLNPETIFLVCSIFPKFKLQSLQEFPVNKSAARMVEVSGKVDSD